MNHNQFCIALTEHLLISENVEVTCFASASSGICAMRDHLTPASLNTIRHLLPYIVL